MGETFKEQIIPLLETELTNSMIARKVGCSPEMVRRVRNEFNVGRPVLFHKSCSIVWNEEKLGKLLKIDIDNYTYRELGDMIGIPPSNIITKLKELGIKKKPQKRGFQEKYTDDEIKQMYIKHGGHITNMAKEFGVAPPSISRRCSRLGLKGTGLSTGARVKYTKEKIEKYYIKHNGNVCRMADDMGEHEAGVRAACKRLGFKPKGIGSIKK
jgi:transposase-like protein